ncbi:gamma-glutamylcyclotransferase [Cupriavidus pauculus]|uniref:Gamma-glutamylcyclotransferase n=1 Tax=Cupriavidus pauculus TaxID=82633 RepID=A0A2N5C2P8_9BURK|nr:gamma-glutamylcyclotransferase [Cupriavidus pauculus]
MHYFAYGSNMAIQRLKARVPSAQFVCSARLSGHILKFHKPSKDGSGKCDAAHSGNASDLVLGAVFSILESELPLLDKAEGNGYGYERKPVTVATEALGEICAQTYLATKFDPSLRPLDWYKEHVIRGATSIALPASYIASIEAVACDVDTDASRRATELAIYGSQFRREGPPTSCACGPCA